MASGGEGAVERRLVHEQGGDGRVAGAGPPPLARGERQHVGDVALAVARRQRHRDALDADRRIAAAGSARIWLSA